MRTRLLLPLLVLVVASCKSAPQPAPEAEPAPAPAPAPAEAKKPPPEPVVTLAAPPPIPAVPAPLAPIAAPADSPFTPETVELGHRLFFDKALSKDGSMSCATCHLPEKGWVTSNGVDPKVGGAVNKRNTPTVLNLGYHPAFYWDGRMPTLEAVTAAAWKGQLGADPATTAESLNTIAELKARFKRAYGEGATAENIPKAFASFLRALNNAGSPFDKFQAGDKTAISADAQKGFEVFKKAGCINCHVQPLFSDLDFHNTGIGSDKPEADRDHGRKDATKLDSDEGKFKTPSLRNVALTAPYFHDGSAKTLDDAIDVMASGGVKNAQLDPNLKRVMLNAKDKAALKAFLESLTGTSTFAGPP
jgi:cytochrome c peroxidase